MLLSFQDKAAILQQILLLSTTHWRKKGKAHRDQIV
jgi:hypothetical protein